MGFTGGHVQMQPRRLARGQRGVTLVEIMVALVLGMIITIAIGAAYLSSRQVYRSQTENSRLQETGRYALEVIGRSLRQAGFANIPISPVSTKTRFTGTAINGSDGRDGLGTGPDRVIVQYDWTEGSPCDGDTNRDTDGDRVGNPGQTPIAFVDFVENVINLDTTNAELQCEGVIAANPVAPACNGLTGCGVPLVEGVEDLQILYGVNTNATGSTVQMESADLYTASPTAAQWPNVVSARVCVQAVTDLTDNAQVTTAPQRFLNCDGALGIRDPGTDPLAFTTPNDRRLRRTFVATFNLRNRISSIP